MNKKHLLKMSAAIFWGSVFLLVLGLSGCSSTTAKPEASAASGRASPKAIKPEIQTAQTPGSLEQLRRGQAPVTPKDSPLKEIYFDFDKYYLRPDARTTLKANAEWLKKNPAVRVEIEGHCDERGTNEYNMGLAAKRAEAARDYLVSVGIAGDPELHVAVALDQLPAGYDVGRDVESGHGVTATVGPPPPRSLFRRA